MTQTEHEDMLQAAYDRLEKTKGTPQEKQAVDNLLAVRGKILLERATAHPYETYSMPSIDCSRWAVVQFE